MARKTKSRKVAVQENGDSDAEVVPAKRNREDKSKNKSENGDAGSENSDDVVLPPNKRGRKTKTKGKSKGSSSRKSSTKRAKSESGSDDEHVSDVEPEEVVPSKKAKIDKPQEEEEEYEVEAIVGMKQTKSGRSFRVRWVNHKPKDDTWELEKDLNCTELLNAFLEKREKKNEVKEEESDTEYEVDKVLDVRTVKGKRQFKIHWKKCPKSQDSWEPEDYLNCKDLIEEFLEKKKEDKDILAKDLRVSPKQTDRLTLGASRYRHSRRQDKKARISYHDFLE